MQLKFPLQDHYGKIKTDACVDVHLFCTQLLSFSRSITNSVRRLVNSDRVYNTGISQVLFILAIQKDEQVRERLTVAIKDIFSIS